jgi:excisionase family DNA binding protein
MPNTSPREGADTLALSVKEACAICSFGRTTFYKYLKLGKVPARKFGTRTIVPRDELEQALKSLPRAGRAS